MPAIWMRVDIDFFQHPKVISLHPEAQLLYLRAVAYCRRFLTDGLVSRTTLHSLSSDLSKRVANEKQTVEQISSGLAQDHPDDVEKFWIDSLLCCNLFDKIDANTISIHDFLEWNPSRKDVENIRKSRRKSGYLGGKANAKQIQSKLEANAKQKRSHSTEYIVQSTENKERRDTRPAAQLLVSDEEWIKTLKANPAYAHINLDVELAKMDAWLSLPRNKKRKKTRPFILNWINKIDQPVEPVKRTVPMQMSGKVQL